MAVTWTISTLERNSSDDGVIVAHWRASDYTAYADITEAQAIGWVKDSMGEEAVTGVEDSIAAQIADSKAPALAIGTPW
jgi:hypothetical protein